mgnify:FL=1|jgi:hypothetical protein
MKIKPMARPPSNDLDVIFIEDEGVIQGLTWPDNCCTVGYTSIHGKFNPASFNWMRQHIVGRYSTQPTFHMSSSWKGGNNDESHFQYVCYYSELKGYRPFNNTNAATGEPSAVPCFFSFYFEFNEEKNKALLVRLRMEGMPDRIKENKSFVDFDRARQSRRRVTRR